MQLNSTRIEDTKMGFSIGCSLGSHVLVRNTGKFPSLCGKERFNLSTMCSEFNKPCKIRVSICKNELVDFDERTSPTEVIPLSTYSLVQFFVHKCSASA